MVGTFARFLALVGRGRGSAGVLLSALVGAPQAEPTTTTLTESIAQPAMDEPGRRRIERWRLFPAPTGHAAPQAGHGSHSSHSSHASGTSHGSHYSGTTHSSHSSHYSGTTTGTSTAKKKTASPAPSKSAHAAVKEQTAVFTITYWDAATGRLAGTDEAGVARLVDVVDATQVHFADTALPASSWRGAATREYTMLLPVGGTVVIGWTTLSSSGIRQASSLYLTNP